MTLGQREIEYLKKATKQDVLDLLNTSIAPSAPKRAKLSTHVKSQYVGVKFDTASAQPLVEGFMKHSVQVDQAALGSLMATSPDLDKVKAFARAAVLKTVDLAEGAKEELGLMIESLKGKVVENSTSSEEELTENNIWVDDIVGFKRGLKGSQAARALEPIGGKAKL